jgi:DNA-binding LacI/PurR family transcriptional regulator
VALAAQIDPFLTAMDQPAYTMGTLAMQLLLERITGKYTGTQREIVLSPRLRVRRSCGARLRGWEAISLEDAVAGADEPAVTPMGG